MTRKVLLVCSGNTCRSPMAERLLAARVRRLGLPVEVASAGLHAAEGVPAAEGALAALRRRNLDAADHRSRRLTEALAEEAEVLLTMTRAQKEELLTRFPGAAGKVFTLAEYGERERWAPLLERLQALRAGGGSPRELAALERDLEPMDVCDPYGKGEDVYERCAARLEELAEGVARRLSELWAGEAGDRKSEFGDPGSDIAPSGL